MTDQSDIPFEALEKLFHEPKRLAIMSTLCAAESSLTFTEIKEACELTDGNLNRHLKVLVESKAVTISKRFVSNKPCTSVRITDRGLKRFSQYLDALTDVIEAARQGLPQEQRRQSSIPFANALRA